MQSRLQFWLTPYEFREALENAHALIQHVRNLHPLARLFTLRLNTPRNAQNVRGNQQILLLDQCGSLHNASPTHWVMDSITVTVTVTITITITTTIPRGEAGVADSPRGNHVLIQLALGNHAYT